MSIHFSITYFPIFVKFFWGILGSFLKILHTIFAPRKSQKNLKKSKKNSTFFQKPLVKCKKIVYNIVRVEQSGEKCFKVEQNRHFIT